jgi:glycosyltransferase involved in cell wall biosynthesis
MRIAVVEIGGHGGLLHYATQLADALALRSHDVDLVVPRDNELSSTERRAVMRSVLPRRVPPAKSQPRNIAQYQLRRARVAAGLVASHLCVDRCLRHGGYDAAVLQWDLSQRLGVTALTALAASSQRPRLGYVLHNVVPFNTHAGAPLLDSDRAVNRVETALRGMDAVFVHGERSRAEALERYSDINVVVIPHGDERLFGHAALPPAREPRVLFFGDWRKVKGLPLLMAAFDRVVETMPHARLTIAGTPVPADFDDAPLRRWAAGRTDVELIPQYVPIDDVPDLFARASVVVTPYVAGYQSGVIHLAMTLGRAVVTTDVGDLPRAVVDGETGLVVPTGDHVALAGALLQLLDDPQLARRMGDAGHRRVAANNWDTVAGQMEATLRPQSALIPA